MPTFCVATLEEQALAALINEAIVEYRTARNPHLNNSGQGGLLAAREGLQKAMDWARAASDSQRRAAFENLHSRIEEALLSLLESSPMQIKSGRRAPLRGRRTKFDREWLAKMGIIG